MGIARAHEMISAPNVRPTERGSFSAMISLTGFWYSKEYPKLP